MKKILTIILLLLYYSSINANNLVTNGNFEDGTNNWTINFRKASDQSKYVISTTDGLEISQTGKTDDRVDIQQNISIDKNTTYTLSFDYKATHQKLRIWSYLISQNNVYVYLADDVSMDSLRTNNKYLDTASEWANYKCSFTTPNTDTIPTFRVEFRRYKQQNSTICINNIQLIKQQNDPTDIHNYNSMDLNKPTKFIQNGNIYILRNNNQYNTTGQKIK